MNGILVEVLKFVGYSAIGFLVGFQFCKIRRGVEEIKEAVVNESENEETESTDSSGITNIHQRVTITDWQSHLIGIVVILLSIFTVGNSIYFQQKRNADAEANARTVACQSEYNRDFARAVEIRAQYATEDQNALFFMISTVFNSPQQAARAKAVQDWIIATKKNSDLRAKTPLPNLSERQCEEK